MDDDQVTPPTNPDEGGVGSPPPAAPPDEGGAPQTPPAAPPDEGGAAPAPPADPGDGVVEPDSSAPEEGGPTGL